jgi:DNA-binding MarR family transcriptional regulator
MDKEIHIGKEIIILSNKIHRAIGKEAAQYGVTSVQARIIGFIYRESSKRNIFQRDIEEEFNIRRSSVTSVLQLMEKNGYIIRKSVCEDARLKKLVLTEKGLEIQKNVHDSIIKFEKTLRAELSDDEIDTFINLIHRLSNTIAD